ncbi:hypothetical protein D1007_00794 [Hordeum vulgare]|nr:hypothetical protein D1007_00794 [Hordeum vulgare]
MRCLRPGGARRRQCPLLAAFCSSLVDGLAHLEATLSAEDDDGGGGSAVSMRWCADAMRLVRRMQRDLLAVFRSADAPVTVDAGSCAGEDWLEQYMQETAALLDFCNAFKSAVSRMHRYCMVVDFAAQVGCAGAGGIAASLVAESTAPSSPAATVRGNLSDVKAVVSEAERLGGKIISSSGGSGSMVLVTLVAKITMAVVATSVLHALTHASPPSLLEDDVGVGGAHQRSSTLARAAVPEQLRPWRESLSAINERVAALPASIAEHESVVTAVRDMIGGRTEGSEDHAELLRTRSGELREGVEMFDCVLDQVFDEVIRGRNEMLGIFRDKVLT